MNSENSKPSEPYTFIINLTDRINLKKYLTNTLLYQSLVYITHGEILQNFVKAIDLRYQLQHGIMNLNSLMDLIF